MDEPAQILWSGVQKTEAVVRIGQTVHKPASPNSPFVEQLLRFLAQQHFRAAPKFLGYDEEGRIVLSYIAGLVPLDQDQFSDEQLVTAAHLIRSFHELTAGSVLAGAAEVVCHTDLGPHNMVFVGGLPRAIIDWDEARPGRRVEDLAHAVWSFTDVGCNDIPVEVQAQRIRLMCEAYGYDDYVRVADEIEARLKRAVRRHEEAGRAGAAEVFRAWVEWFDVEGKKLRALLCG